MKMSIIVNPAAGGGRAVRKLRKYLRGWSPPGCQYTLLETHGPEHAGLLASGLLADPPDVLAVCGGDGTMKEVASSVPDPPFPIGIIPAGTANLLAREVGIPADLPRALTVILQGNVRRVDLGSLKGRSQHRFLLMAGIGFDAYVVSHLSPSAKRHLGMAAYFVRALKSHLSYSFEQFQIFADDVVLPATSCIVANARSYGGGLRLTPDADISSGSLEILVVQRASALRFAAFIVSAWARKPAHPQFIRRLRSRSIRVEGPRGIWVQVDGETVGTLPVEISVAQSAFPLLVPASPV